MSRARLPVGRIVLGALLIAWAVNSPKVHHVFDTATSGTPAVTDAGRSVVHGVHSLESALGISPRITDTDQATFDRTCPMLDAYLAVDSEGQTALGPAITAVATAGASRSTAPAVKAVLGIVPAALGDREDAETQSALALIARECSLRGDRLTNT